MTKNPRRRHRIGLLALSAASAALMQVGHGAQGATESWTAADGDWDTSANWNNGAGPVPGAGDTVDITQDDGTSRTVTYNYTGSAITLASLTVDNDGIGTNTLAMTDPQLLAVTNEYFGDSHTSTLPGYGVLTQSTGINGVSDGLYLGVGADDQGFYTLGGTGALQAANEYLGYGGGGTVNQNAGTNIVTATLYLGYGSGSAGNYTLSGGSISVAGNESIAFGGTGTFNQSAGTNTATNSLTIANNANGSYSLSGTGTLSVGGNEYIGNGGGGSGTFSQSGGTNTVTLATNTEYVGYTSNGTYIQSGGVNNMSSPASLQLGYSTGVTGIYSLSGTGQVINANFEGIGGSGTGSFIQTGGMNKIFGSMLDIGDVGGGGGYYSLGAGTLMVLDGGLEDIASNGTFVQTGGLHQVGDSADETNLSIEGSYSLGGTGTLSVTGVECIAASGTTATFIQTGGTNTLAADSVQSTYDSALCIAEGAGSLGSYSLSGTGTLSAGADSSGVYVGGSTTVSGGEGSLTVSGGQMTVAGTLEVWNTSGTKLTISGGTVSAGNTVNLATINVTGGSANLGPITGTGTLTVGDAAATVTASGLQQSSVTITSTGQLTLTAGGPTNAVNSLLIDTGGVFDLTSTRLIVNYGSGSDPVSTIYGYLKSGYNNGGWNGSGIISSSARSLTDGLRYGVGWADSKDGVVSGLSSGRIEVKYTLLGDANLDGTVNGSDFSILAANFGKGLTNWDQGNFLYGSSVNGSDFSALAANFGQGDSGTDATITPADIAALDAFAIANDLPLPTFASVPEPGCALLLSTAACAALVRRRRK